jgi:hypothetical protein
VVRGRSDGTRRGAGFSQLVQGSSQTCEERRPDLAPARRRPIRTRARSGVRVPARNTTESPRLSGQRDSRSPSSPPRSPLPSPPARPRPMPCPPCSSRKASTGSSCLSASTSTASSPPLPLRPSHPDRNRQAISNGCNANHARRHHGDPHRLISASGSSAEPTRSSPRSTRHAPSLLADAGHEIVAKGSGKAIVGGTGRWLSHAGEGGSGESVVLLGASRVEKSPPQFAADGVGRPGGPSALASAML